MNSGTGQLPRNRVNPEQPSSCFLQKFKLYETRSNFYLIGRDKCRTFWRVLKINRLDPSELNILEDPATYSDNECYDLLKRIDEGNKSMGGLKLITNCYGIVGFVKFLGPYYMIIITKRRKIGTICGHTIYAISKSEMIPVPNPAVRSKLANSKNDENRYKKLLCTLDLTKDFFFSYSYNIMFSLQKNICDRRTGSSLYETMFVWNEYLTHGIRYYLKNTLWTVALVYGFFKQVNLSVSGRDFKLTLIARRSRHFAGTRYLKRGVNEKGKVANDVETEQLVIEDAPEGHPVRISSVVQHRGSIPLFWSQETSRLNIKPDIILSRKDHNYEATRLHFENLVQRYGDPIIILNLIKTNEKKPRETILRAEFSHAIRFINRSLPKESCLRFLHWDLHKHARSKATNVLAHLGKVATYALGLTGIFYCQVNPIFRPEGLSGFEKNDEADDCLSHSCSSKDEDADSREAEISNGSDGDGASMNCNITSMLFQKGVLRTNCIDCLDRTNVAQYSYGLVALGHQLHALGFIESPDIDLDNPLAEDLMRVYESMGDILALQYGGSPAHNKIFSETRGQWKAATQSQEFFRTIQRFYSNTYVDGVKQDAINVFLGYFQPQPGKPQLWELNSDQHYNVGRSFIKRSLSEGHIVSESDSPMASTDVGHNQPLSEIAQGSNRAISESAPAISTCESEISYSRFTPSMPCKQLFGVLQEHECHLSDHIIYDEHDDDCNLSNFLDADWLSTSGNSCEEECGRSMTSLSSENLVNGPKIETSTSASESGSTRKGKEQYESEVSRDNVTPTYSESFMDWVANGELLFL
ncbi:phosphoinositide phosphatase SAC2-like [Pyrus ussuriensis x Pyrus communis]|uniref:Phosphoinositide phosphatase SAC2-like n=1 Tax=Pyrus ussuriensis x Pyrus communis TaxID=2448454 RepID=A0A5N5GCF4_9ROSA|nr:phosphoinositide phosphatase SAC2-like [Pyrus ussuriensis x Pyrus communis]